MFLPNFILKTNNMWESILRPAIFAGSINWVCAGLVYYLEGRISYILVPSAIIWTTLAVVSYIKTKKNET